MSEKAEAGELVKKRGRPRIELDEDMVRGFAAVGYTMEEVALLCGCSVSTLYRNYDKAMKEGVAIRNGAIRRKQVERALAGDNTMLIWLGKTLLGQVEASKLEIQAEVTHRDEDAYTEVARRIAGLRERIGSGGVPPVAE